MGCQMVPKGCLLAIPYGLIGTPLKWLVSYIQYVHFIYPLTIISLFIYMVKETDILENPLPSMTFDANIRRLPGQRQRQCQGREENPTSEVRADWVTQRRRVYSYCVCSDFHYRNTSEVIESTTLKSHTAKNRINIKQSKKKQHFFFVSINHSPSWV